VIVLYDVEDGEVLTTGKTDSEVIAKFNKDFDATDYIDAKLLLLQEIGQVIPKLTLVRK
jgi:hypothetical protein